MGVEGWIDEHPLFAAPAAPPEYVKTAAQKGWAPGLVDRAFAMRVPRADIDSWLHGGIYSPDDVARHLESLERLFEGPIRAREATWRDNEALVDLYANAPEQVGDFEVVVERSPYPYAQFRLQEHFHMQVLECRGVLLAAAANSARNAYVEGQRLAIHLMSAWRVREGFRGKGLSRLLQTLAGPGTAWLPNMTYWYERSGNASKVWLDKLRNEMDDRSEQKVAGLSATVHVIAPQPLDPAPNGLSIRNAKPADLPRCVELINQTHAGLDLFRPYTVEFLEGRLDDPAWGPRPGFWPAVYSWDDFFVAERDGVIEACGGLWDKGRHVRERWRHGPTGEESVVEPTAILDWGFDDGAEASMTALVRDFVARTAELGRTHLLAPFEFAPQVAEQIAELSPQTETRALHTIASWEGETSVQATITKPYTDLVYW